MTRRRLIVGNALLSLLLTLGSCHSARQSYQAVYIGKTGNRYVGTTSFCKARIRWHPYRLQLTTKTGTTETRPPDQVWGLQQINGPRYRLYQGEFYEEIDDHPLLIYRRADLGGSSHDQLFFSLTPTAEVIPLTRRHLQLLGLSAPKLHHLF